MGINSVKVKNMKVDKADIASLKMHVHCFKSKFYSSSR